MHENIRLTLEVLPLVVRVRWALWREPFPAFYAAWNKGVEGEFHGAQEVSSSTEGEPDADTRRIVWECAHAVSRAARLVPRASCLTQALTLQRVLARRGQACSLLLGVDRRAPSSSGAPMRSKKGVEAHAWIEWHGRVLIGGDISRWTPFPLSTPSRVSQPSETAREAS